MTQRNGSVPVVGDVPALIGEVCSGLICEGFELGGALECDANVVYMQAAGRWHRLAIDAGVVFWRLQEGEPSAWSVPEEGWSYPHRDIGSEQAFVGQTISAIEARCAEDAVEVVVRFDDGRSFILRNANDRSSFAIRS